MFALLETGMFALLETGMFALLKIDFRLCS